MSIDYAFSDDELAVDESLGYPKAYAKLCRDRSVVGLYNHGPPFAFMPYSLHPNEAARAKELDRIFPIIDPKAKSTAKVKIFVSLLWKQLGHLGNAGFDPTVIRVDPYGNVLYYNADSASPLAWEIDHWFPCSRGGLTVPSNLRIIQRRVCKKKHNTPEFLVPWWDLQLGISVNQFLNIFASSHSDFRHRAFSFLFSEGENEELNALQTVDSHSFPQHFIEAKEQIGLAAAAIVPSRREFHGASSALKSLDYNRQSRPHSPAIVPSQVRPSISKENENPHLSANPYQAIVMARDSLKQREEFGNMQAEVQKLDDEVNELRQKNEEERLTIQDLEMALIKRKRRAEKCRRLAESQCSYRTMLEKMIREAMHQSVVYKEQVRLNQAAINALMARLEAQKSMSDSSENELHRKYRQRDELEKQIRPEWDQGRKRSRIDDTVCEERENTRNVLCLGGPRTSIHKELRVFLEEEQKASEAGLSPTEYQHKNEIENEDIAREEIEGHNKALIAFETENSIDDKFRMLAIGEKGLHNIKFPDYKEPLEEDGDEERRKERGKGHVEKWLQMLLDTPDESGLPCEDDLKARDEIIRKMNLKHPHENAKSKFYVANDKVDKEKAYSENKQHIVQEIDEGKLKDEISEMKSGKGSEENGISIEAGSSIQPESRQGTPAQKPGMKKNAKEPKLTRSDSFRAFRRIPSSPSMILGLKKGVDCMGKKPAVTSDDEVDGYVGILKSSIKTIKRAVKN